MRVLLVGHIGAARHETAAVSPEGLGISAHGEWILVVLLVHRKLAEVARKNAALVTIVHRVLRARSPLRMQHASQFSVLVHLRKPLAILEELALVSNDSLFDSEIKQFIVGKLRILLLLVQLEYIDLRLFQRVHLLGTPADLVLVLRVAVEFEHREF